MRIAEKGHPSQDRRIGSVVEEHVPEKLCADEDGTVLRISCFVEADLRRDQFDYRVIITVS